MTHAAAAIKLKQLLIEVSPLLEEYSAQTCPECKTVCCKQRRSTPDQVDLLYYSVLNERPPNSDCSRDPDGPCQFMGPRGCVNPRSIRPWRCTWYFCDPLLEALANGPQKKARRLSALIQEIVDLRSSLNDILVTNSSNSIE